MEADSLLPGAVDRLHAAVGALVDPIKRMAPGGVQVAPSLLEQLRQEVPASVGERAGRSHGKSIPPIWADALDVVREIDDAVSAWQPDGCDTPARLSALASRRWRPEDVKGIDQIVSAVEAWSQAIRDLLDPPRRWTLPNPCPACNTAVVYRKDSSGETVRQPALQIGPNGCECAKCHTAWTPDKFVFLARLLGTVPGNVLE